MFDKHRGQTLLHLARAAIGKELGFHSSKLPPIDWLEEPGATFVTLTLYGRMHGCIGSLEAHRPLIDDVCQNAVAAAFFDPRYTPLTKKEFADVVIDVALLTRPEEIHFSSEADALEHLNPGLDGVSLDYQPPAQPLVDAASLPSPNHATLLPHAWFELPDPHDYLAELKHRAGLPDDFWSQDIKLSHFTIQKWREGGRRQSDHHG